MFEKRIGEISERLGKEKKVFFIITHKKHRREIYFQNSERAIDFMKSRFNSIGKRVVYLLIKWGILQPFLKKIRLSKDLGEIIFVAGQIKAFDLKTKKVFSFIKGKEEKEDFIRSKEEQKRISRLGFAPLIYNLDKDWPMCEEELLEQYKGGEDIKVFKKIYSFYEKKGIKKVDIGEFSKYLMKEAAKKEIRDKLIYSVLGKISLSSKKILVAEVHGDLSKEQVLEKNGSFVFTDWSLHKGLIIEDLVNFFLTEEKLTGIPSEKNKNFLKLLGLYPKEVRENIGIYLIMNEIHFLIRRDKELGLYRSRLRRFLSEYHFSMTRATR